MADWRLARSLETLRSQINAQLPNRDKSWDGTLGDAAHAARKSEHNPDEHGVVRAMDITHDPAHGFDSYAFADFLRENWDDRVQYIISNRRIANIDVGAKAWRPYSGENAHDHHVHISARADDRADDSRPWATAQFFGAAIQPPAPFVPFVPLDQRTIDAIASAATSSDLAHYTWGGRGRAPIGYVKGMAVVFGMVLRKLVARDSAALAMVRIVNGPGDVFDHYQVQFRSAGIVTAGAPDVDRLRALFVVLTGLGMRESSGNYSEGRDMSASNTSADTAEAGLFQMSWNAHTTNSEISKLFDASNSDKYTGLLEIFREGVRDKNTDEFGDGPGAAFQLRVKTKPAFAVEAAAIGLRTLYPHWGPIARHEAEVVPAADALFRQVQELVGVASPVPAPKPIPTDPTPPWVAKPSIPGATMDDKARLAIITETCKPAPDVKALHLMLLDAPVVPAPSGTGGTLPATPPIATPPAPAIPNTIPNNLSLGGAGSLAAIAASLAGLLGMPVGPEMTQTGLWSFAIPLISGLLKANVPAANAVLGMIGGKKS